MKILISGKGGAAGSWAIRGLQLGEAMGATVKPKATLADCESADLIVLVKHVPVDTLEAVRQSGKPWVLDMVDFWPQPCDWNQEQSVAWLQDRLWHLKPAGVVYGTNKMREDAGMDGLVLPHHSWCKYVDRQPTYRSKMKVMGYEGNVQFLGRWREVLGRQCRDRGLELIINGDMRHADVGIALRDGGGYPGRYWKPGTKLSNLHALGIPALCTPEAGAESVACGHEFWINEEADIRDALDALETERFRKSVCVAMHQAMIRIEDVAENYLKWLERFA